MKRFVLPALLTLLLAGMLWLVFEGRRQALEAEHPATSGSGAGGDPKLEGRAAPGASDAVQAGAGAEAEQAWTPPPLKPGHAPVTITVLDWAGRPLEGALVELRPRGRSFTTLKTDAEGKAAFPDIDVEKKCDLLVYTWPFMQARSHRKQDWTPQDLTLELERALTIAGRVLDEDGQLAPDFRVSYRLPGDEEVHDVLDLPDGTFEITDLGPGKIELWATHREHKRRYLQAEPPRAAGPVQVEAGVQDVVLEVARGGILHVHIQNALVDERRGPLKARATAEGSGRVHEAEVDLDGHAVFLGLSPFDTYRLTVYGLGRSQYVDLVDVRPGKKTIEVESRAGAHVHGTFEIPDAALLPGRGTFAGTAEVVARHASLGSVRGLAVPRTGRYRVEGLPPDTEWTLVLRLTAHTTTGERSFEGVGAVRAGAALVLTLREVAPKER